ncbi:MAG TPA: hypothetical protein VK484_02230, partial [Ferruginibacter sp.]|nr:hypothetical protein [Ferruginibacter sp.]
MYTLSQIASVTRAKTSLSDAEAIIEHILLDSRKLLFPAASLFFALPGPRRNGNIFIKELYNKGVRSFVVDESFTEEEMKALPDAAFFQVPDVLQAL